MTQCGEWRDVRDLGGKAGGVEVTAPPSGCATFVVVVESADLGDLGPASLHTLASVALRQFLDACRQERRIRVLLTEPERGVPLVPRLREE